MNSERKTLWGIPIIESGEMPKGEVLLGPMPTRDEILRFGSFEQAVEHRKNEWAKLKMDDQALSASEIE